MLLCCAPEQRPEVVELLAPATEPLSITETVVGDWDLSKEAERLLWHRPEPGPEPSGEGLLMPWRDGQAHADRGLAVDPREIDVLEVRLAGVRGSDVEVRWHGQGQDGFASSRSTRLDADRGVVEDGDRIWHLNLRASPGWVPPVDRLRVVLRSRGGAPRTLKRVRALRRRFSQEDWHLAQDPHRIVLADEVRDGVVVAPDGTLTRGLRLPRRAWLQFAWGVLSAARQHHRFELAVQAHGGKSTTVWTRELPSGADAFWREAEADLGAWSGQEVELTFSVSSPAGLSPEHGLPVWGDLRLLSAVPDPRPDVVLISVDTLRADRVQPVDPPRETAPRIGAWARLHAVSFENLAVQATWTLPSHTSMLTGLDALTHGVNYTGSRLSASRVSLAEVLRSAGYRTVAATEPGWLHPRFGLDQGFQSYRYRPAGVSEADWLRTNVDQLLAQLVPGDRAPVFAFLHTMLVHEYRKGRSADDPARAYDRAVEEMDRELGRLLDFSSEPRQRARTLFVLTSDHGELLGELGKVGHGYLHEANVRAPLLVQLPSGLGAGRVFRQQVRTVDVAPTILDRLGLALPEGVQGRSLLPLVSGETSSGVRLTRIYSAGGDDALGLRTADGLKFVLHNGVRHGGITEREELWQIDGRGRQEPLTVSGDPRAASLAALAHRSLSLAGGFHLEAFSCAEPSKIRLTPLAGTLDLFAVKSLDLPAGALQPRSEAGLEVRVSEEGVSLVLEQLPGPRLRFEVVRAGRVAWGEDFDLSSLGPDWARASDGSLERTVSAGPCPVLLRWRSQGGQVFDVGSAADREVERQLKALGYLGGE